jgi:hypothetical protein
VQGSKEWKRGGQSAACTHLVCSGLGRRLLKQKCVRKRSGTGNATPQTDLNVRVALELSLALFEPVHVA